MVEKTRRGVGWTSRFRYQTLYQIGLTTVQAGGAGGRWRRGLGMLRLREAKPKRIAPEMRMDVDDGNL